MSISSYFYRTDPVALYKVYVDFFTWLNKMEKMKRLYRSDWEIEIKVRVFSNIRKYLERMG